MVAGAGTVVAAAVGERVRAAEAKPQPDMSGNLMKTFSNRSRGRHQMLRPSSRDASRRDCDHDGVDAIPGNHLAIVGKGPCTAGLSSELIGPIAVAAANRHYLRAAPSRHSPVTRVTEFAGPSTIALSQ